jgi:hypothetical protein
MRVREMRKRHNIGSRLVSLLAGVCGVLHTQAESLSLSLKICIVSKLRRWPGLRFAAMRTSKNVYSKPDFRSRTLAKENMRNIYGSRMQKQKHAELNVHVIMLEVSASPLHITDLSESIWIQLFAIRKLPDVKRPTCQRLHRSLFRATV